jgi:8-oxo-dGTP diphosphatase
MAGPLPVPPDARYRLAVDVNLLLINSAGEVLLERTQRTGCPEGAWGLPSSPLNSGESTVAALIRTAREVTGLIIDEEEAVFAHVMHDSSDGGKLLFFFAARNWTGDLANLEPGKRSELAWCSLDALPYFVTTYCRIALEWIAVSCWFSTYGWLQHRTADSVTYTRTYSTTCVRHRESERWPRRENHAGVTAAGHSWPATTRTAVAAAVARFVASSLHRPYYRESSGIAAPCAKR